jgi:hypothetical protein
MVIEENRSDLLKFKWNESYNVQLYKIITFTFIAGWSVI